MTGIVLDPGEWVADAPVVVSRWLRGKLVVRTVYAAHRTIRVADGPVGPSVTVLEWDAAGGGPVPELMRYPPGWCGQPVEAWNEW